MPVTKPILNDVKELINWVSDFDEEYGLPAEVVTQLKNRLDKLSKDISKL